MLREVKFNARMFAVLRFFVFNVVLSAFDVGTDILTFFELLPDNPRWACLTLTWAFMPFFVRLTIYLFKRATGERKALGTFAEEMRELYNEAGVHLPLVSTIHNILRTKRLYELGFRTKFFNMKDHREVEKILDAAGLCSQGESNYEAGPQSVTQVG